MRNFDEDWEEDKDRIAMKKMRRNCLVGMMKDLQRKGGVKVWKKGWRSSSGDVREMGGRGRYMNMGGWKCKSTMDGSFKMVRRHERSWDGG